MFTTSIICVMECYRQSFNMQKIIKIGNFHHVSSFISINFEKKIDLEISLFNEIPNKIYLFDKNHKRLDYYTRNKIVNSYLQESLVIFYTSNLMDCKSFIDFLVAHLSVRNRPKCMIYYAMKKFEFNQTNLIISNL